MKYLDNNGLSYLIQKIKIWLSGKVDKVDGKTLTTNDFTNDYKSKVDANTTARHTHSNKAVLDGITSDKITEWDNKLDEKNMPEDVFVWDGKSSAENSANIALFQKIYNAYASGKQCNVLVDCGYGTKTLLTRIGILSTSTKKLILDGSYTELSINASGNWAYQYFVVGRAVIGDNGVVTSVESLETTDKSSSFVSKSEIPEEVFVWDGKSSTENSANLALFQKIYNAWLATGKALVIVKNASGDTSLLSTAYIQETSSKKFILDGSVAEVSIPQTGGWVYQYTKKVTAIVGSDDVITQVNAIEKSYVTSQFVDKESDPIFKASAAYGITSDNITAWNNKAEASSIPTKVSQLTNDSKYQTQTQVQTAINAAVGEITGIDLQIVTELPSTGEKGVFYLVSNGGSGQNIYDEYIWANNKFEFIGTTAVDLSDYLKKTDAVAITNAEIDTIVA